MLIRFVCRTCGCRWRIEEAEMVDLAKEWICCACKSTLTVEGCFQKIEVTAAHPSGFAALTLER